MGYHNNQSRKDRFAMCSAPCINLSNYQSNWRMCKAGLPQIWWAFGQEAKLPNHTLVCGELKSVKLIFCLIAFLVNWASLQIDLFHFACVVEFCLTVMCVQNVLEAVRVTIRDIINQGHRFQIWGHMWHLRLFGGVISSEAAKREQTI